ncbi:MAG: hypothetical protein Q9226_003623 [Calogaya cf. arnoldii]
MKVLGLGDAAPSPAEGYHANLGMADDDVTEVNLSDVLQRAKAEGVRSLTITGIHHTVLVCEKYAAQCRKNDCGANYFANVMQKVNIKIGGINHVLAEQGRPLDFLTQSSTMFVGVDVTHPATDNMINPPSVVGVVASLDSTYTTWLGVSEGQFKRVLLEEISAIEEMCKVKYTSKNFKVPKIVVIICGKRHQTRFYPTKEEDADQQHNYNTRSGTVVDRSITSEYLYDFFIQAHAALKGTAIPCHYTVIRDDIQIGPDAMQKITHSLSYLYGRATKAVSLCAPAYYADIMCARGNNYLAKYLNMKWPPGTEFSYDRSPWVENVHSE